MNKEATLPPELKASLERLAERFAAFSDCTEKSSESCKEMADILCETLNQLQEEE